MKHILNTSKGNIEIRALTNGIIRVRVDSKKEPLLTKYNIISENFEEFKSELNGNTVSAGDYKVTLNGDTLEFTGGKKLFPSNYLLMKMKTKAFLSKPMR